MLHGYWSMVTLVSSLATILKNGANFGQRLPFSVRGDWRRSAGVAATGVAAFCRYRRNQASQEAEGQELQRKHCASVAAVARATVETMEVVRCRALW